MNWLKKTAQGSVSIGGMSALALFMFLWVGPIGALGFCLFYIYVFGVFELGVLTEDLGVAYLICHCLLALTELMSQRIFRRSIMGRVITAISFSLALIVVAAVVQFLLPVAPRYDTVSVLLGFENRHPMALVSEITAAAVASMCGLFSFWLFRKVMVKQGVLY